MFCGEKLIELTLTMLKTSHIQKMTIMAVCDTCDKPSEAMYGVHDIRPADRISEEFDVVIAVNNSLEGVATNMLSITCSNCGGSMSLKGGEWHCAACEAIG